MPYLIKLNGKTIETASELSLAALIWKTFSTQWNGKRHFDCGRITRKEWEEWQCKRLDLENFSGELELIKEGEDVPIETATLLPILEVKHHSDESGFCRRYFVPTDKSDKRLVCLHEPFDIQDQPLECTRDGEPSHNIKRALVIV